MSYIVCRTLYVVHYMSYIVFRTLYVVYCMSYSVCRTLYVLHYMSYTMHLYKDVYVIAGMSCGNFEYICVYALLLSIFIIAHCFSIAYVRFVRLVIS